jgi:pimeloyl-ACP methyl ester carboxylesterase
VATNDLPDSVAALPIVLVHGGAHGAWCWEPMLPFLEGTVLAIDLPPKAIRGVVNPTPTPPEIATTTLDDFARSALADIDAAGIDRFVLVGHSMGGLTLAELARRVPERIEHLVFVSCMVPPEGGLVVDGVPATSSDAAHDVLIAESTESETTRVGMDEASIRRMFCNDMDDAQTQFVLDHTGTEAFAIFGESVNRTGIPPDLPKTYVRLARDQALTPSDQETAIERLRESPGGDVSVVELDTGHDVMISAPKTLATALHQIVRHPAA